MENFVTTDIKAEGYAVVTLAREPVNSMNLELWSQLDAALAALEDAPEVRGVLFQSGLKRDVFTAGNDIFELYAPKTTEQRYTEFWVKQTTFLARLYRSPLVTVAAIRGACPAGGCITALCCDHRVMTEVGHLGLNEVVLGIPVPIFWGRLMALTVGQRQAERLLLGGLMPDAGEALRLGLIDAVVPVERLLPAAEEAMRTLLEAPAAARRVTKEQLRGDVASAWAAFAAEEARSGWALLNRPDTVKSLEGVMARLAKRK